MAADHFRVVVKCTQQKGGKLIAKAGSIGIVERIGGKRGIEDEAGKPGHQGRPAASPVFKTCF